MKKLLAILTLLLAVISIHATETTLWESTYTDGIELNSETVATFKAGDKLRIYATVPSGGANFKICYKGAANGWSETTIPSIDTQWPWINGDQTYYEFAFTDEDITDLTGMNIYIYKGENSTITKVTLVSEESGPSYEGTVIYNNGDVVMGKAWDKYIQLSADKFTDLNPGAVIRVYIKDVLDDVQAVFQNGSWQDIEGVDAVYPAASDTYYELTLTSAVLAVVKESGLIIKGKNFTAVAVTITSTGTATTQYTLTITQPTDETGTIKIGDVAATTKAYDENTVLELTADPISNYQFDNWVSETEGVVTDANKSTSPLSVTMNKDIAISAAFSIINAKILDWKHEYASNNDYNLSSAVVGDKVRITFAKTSEEGGDMYLKVSAKSETWAYDPTFHDGTISTTTFDIDVTSENQANITVRGLYLQGSNITIQNIEVVSAKTEQTLKQASKVMRGESYNTIVTVAASSFTNASAGDVITINMSAVAESGAIITLKENGGNYGQLTTNYNENLTSGQTAYTLEITSDILSKLQSNGLFITGSGFTCGNITISSAGSIIEDTSANPAEKYTLTITAPENGSITVKDGDHELSTGDIVQEGTTLTLSATANGSYAFSKWQKDGADLEDTNNPTTIDMPSDNMTLTAVFAVADTRTEKTLVSGSVVCGNEETATTTIPGYKFKNAVAGDEIVVHLSAVNDGATIVPKNPSNYNSYLGDAYQASIATDATEYRLALTTDMITTLKTAGLQVYGKNLTIGVIALNTDSELGTEDPVINRTFTTSVTPTGSGTVTVKLGNENGTVTTDTEFPQSTQLTAIAAANEGYQFVKWQLPDGTTAATTVAQTVTLEDNIEFIAVFEAKATTLAELESRTLWENLDGQAMSWNEICVKDATWGAILEKNEEIQVTVSAKTSAEWPKVILRDASSEEITNTLMNDVSEYPYVVKFTLTTDFLTKMANGFKISGDGVTITKVALYKPVAVTPVFDENGKADLSKLEKQDEATTISVSEGKATVTTQAGWTGVQLTVPNDESASGKEIKITMSEAKALKVTVKETSEDSGTDFNLESAAVHYIEFDETTSIYQIQIQPTEATTLVIEEIKVNAESTKPAEPDNPDDPSQTGVNICLDNLNEGWNSTYDVETMTIDITSDWGARGWYIGDDRYNSKGSVTVKFKAVDFPVTLKMEFTNTAAESKSVSAGAAIGETEVTVDIPTDIKTMDKVYVTFEKAGKLVLTEATVNDKVVDNRTEKTLVEKTQTIADGDIEINCGLFSNAVIGDVLRIYATDLGEGSKIALEPVDYSGAFDGANWTGFTESPFTLKLTASLLAKAQAQNLLVRGENFTFLKATLYTEQELGEAISDGGDDEEDDISNADASEETKKLFSVLKDLYGKKIVSGVVANIDWNTKEAENVYKWTGKYPAMNVYDYINLHASKDVNSEGWVDYSDISTAKNWWKEGGIVGAMWHWQMKANNGTDYTCTPGTAADETSFDASKVYVDGTSENTLAKQQLDQLCGYLKKMQDAGIPVVWRPLHEGSGNVEQFSGGTAWFWWGAKGADVYKKLWQWMYNYMVKTKGLNNLIWVWTSQTGDKDWYPGDAYVDIIGRDNYGATAAKLATEYEDLKDAYPNKMITLSECGNSDDDEMATLSSIWNAGSRWSWFMTWYDSDYNEGKTTTHKHTSEAWWKDAVGKDYVVTRDQMKELLGQTSSDDSQTGVNISLDDLNEGWSSSYNSSTKTITTEGEWAARGWYIGDDRYNSKGSITVKYEAVTFGVTLKMEYTNTGGDSKSVSAGAATGETEVELDIPADVKTIEKVYITFQPVGKLVLTAAIVNDKVVDNRTEKTLVEKEAKIADGDIKINRGLFSNAAAKDIIRIYATGLSDASKIALEPGDYSGAIDGANWTAFTESPFELKLTETVLATIKEKGLLVRGESYTFTKAVLYTEKDLGSEISDGGDDGGGSGDNSGSSDSSSSTTEETIFDKKDGEADLSHFAAQDEKTTTVTYNKKEGTLTITTTEEYKAAQIWFNTPEEVTGNVLLVEIAESNIDVTVTVGYTDGSESSMSSRVSATRFSSSAMTRASAETTISVPLEMGKEVQKIEVKKAKAGTITINSMVMTNQNVFTNGKANLSMLKSQSGATYDISTYTLATTKGWTGVTLTPLKDESVKGAELVIRFTDNAKVKVAVKYRDNVEGPSTIMEEPEAVLRLALDLSKAIQEISIQPTEAAIITFSEIAVYPAKGMGGLLSEGVTLELWKGYETLSWNEIAHQKANIGSELQEYDEILVTVSAKAAGNDWPKVFLRDVNSEMVGNEILLNEVETFPYVARFVLTKALVEKLKNGFCICGDGVTVTKVELYRPYAPKKGDIHLHALDYGYGSEYDAVTNTITTTQRWAARGWEIGDSRYNNKNLVLVQFEAVNFPVTLKIEYVDAYGQKQATSAGVAGGNTEVRLAIPSGIKQMDRAYIIFQNPGSLTLTNAEVITALQASSRGISEDSRGISISGSNSFRPDGSYSVGDDAWYTLSGQRIEKPTAKGVYIHNGKTVVVH